MSRKLIMATGKWATLLVALVVVLTMHSLVQKLERRDSSLREDEETDNSAGNNGEDESKYTSKSMSSGPISQQRLVRWMQERNRRENDSVNKQDWFGHSLSTNRHSFQEKAAATEIPVEQQQDLVISLPGQPKVHFAQYAGYVTVNETVGRALFYYFVEATESPEKKPLVLWLNGGPGCSSLGYGAFLELGPFRVNGNGALYTNRNAWNQQANILFLESPAGVGFSYSNYSKDYNTSGDARTASDSLNFLLNWFERFPQYKYRDFYLAGESYAGYYIPELAQLLYHYNNRQTNASILLKGFLIGNGVTDERRDTQGIVDYAYSHALISNESYVPLQQCLQTANISNCNFTDAINDEGQIDPYDIYGLSCSNSSSSTNSSVANFDYCNSVNFVTDYFNRRAVQEALHANVTGVSYPWALCSDDVNFNWQDQPSTVIPIYQELISAGLYIYVYSGDVDSVVPVTSTRYSLGLLNLKTKDSWSPWYSQGEVGGYWERYEGLTFVTVRGSGHEVPFFQPERALTMFTSYINHLPLPTSS